ncbi:MAG: acyl-CoA dehydrogenase family protein, partial [Chloroflexi bacterium]|nr:acyl-CoA dehydrogenase family protein [Chloroflexota bacterium]
MIQFTEEQLAVQRMVRDLAREYIAPKAKEWDERGQFPDELRRLFTEHDLFVMYLPEEYGGLGFDLTTQCLVIEEVAKVDGAAAVTLQDQGTSTHLMLNACTPEQRREFLPQLKEQSRLVAFCLSEPGSGSDAGGLQTHANRAGDVYRLNGSKTWVTNGGPAEWYLVFALTDPEKRTRGGISVFLVDRETEGLGLGKPMKKMGLRSSATIDLFLDDVVAPSSRLLGAEGDGFKYAMLTFEASRPQVATMGLGIAEGAYEYALNYSKERYAFGQPISQFQGIQFMLADMITAIEASRLLIYQSTAMFDRGLPNVTYQASLAKLFATDTAMKVTTDAVQILGGAGYITEHPVERMMRDAKI